MQKGHKRLVMLLLILTALFICGFSATTANAAGFKKMNGKTYYIKSDGSKAKGWLKIGKRRYYFNKITGAVRQKNRWLNRHLLFCLKKPDIIGLLCKKMKNHTNEENFPFL